jgi:hypothetical protein
MPETRHACAAAKTSSQSHQAGQVSYRTHRDEVLQIGKEKVPVADESVDTTGCTDNDVSERVFIGKKLDVRLDRCPTTVYLEVSGECDGLALLVFDSGTAIIGVGKGVLSSV